MNLRALEILEFHKVKEMLASQATSKPGKELALELKVSKDYQEISTLQEETKEAVQLLMRRSNPPLVGIREMKEERKRLAIGGYLSPKSLLELADSLRGVQYMKSFFSDNDGDRDSSYPILEGHVKGLTPIRGLEIEISKAILSEDEIADDASPKLRSIRRNMVSKKEGVRKKLQQIVASASKYNYLQDNIVTVREGRYVIPVKQENKSSIKGLVHDMSASGATVFIEPIEVVELNNQIRELETEEKTEIIRILQELSNRAADYLYELEANELIMITLDFIFAKGKLALLQKATYPVLSEKQEFHLKEARHPLLDPKGVVPINVWLGKDFTSLIITGPNTGGKTVTLKTVGLLQCMAQSGLHIPAAEESEVGIFEEIYADIGDEQSIEQSLSTFSSHMVNIVKILKEANNRSLVLFDELGAGTDPTEGAALAMTIMDHMLQNNIRTMATTHYTQLKIYALNTDGVANASMEFNIETLSPTFHLMIGMPGKSNAFEISRRLGLSDDLIERGKSLIEEDSLAFEDVLVSMEEERQKLQKTREASDSEREKLKRKSRELDKELEKTRKEKERIIEEARAEARRILQGAKEDAELSLSEIRDVAKTLDREKERKIQQAREFLNKNLKEVSKEIANPIIIEEVSKPIEEVKVGDTVYAKSLGSHGTILELPDNQGQVLVQMGILKMNLPLNSLVYSAEPEEEIKSQRKMKKMQKGKASTIRPELDLRGKSFEEAKALTDKYLDDAYLSGLKSVRIIHGKGTGVLREKLRPYLRGLMYVKKAKEGTLEEGGSGVTIVELE
ncbi:MAG: endonuclease MutS2 [Tissierellia bacterium]|nr:endonuclease MutS2 [Tissierellia bacterium]